MKIFFLIFLFTIPFLYGENLDKEDGIIAFQNKDYKKAYEVLYPFSIAGDFQATWYIANLLKDGKGIEKNEKEAFVLFKNLADNNIAIAQYFVGNMLYAGEGVLQNKKEAASWFEKAAKQNEPRAQYFLGWMLFNGDGILKDNKKAAYWIEKSYNNGWEQAAQFWKLAELWKYKE